MDAGVNLHPSDEALLAYGLGKLIGDSAQRVSEHLDSCDDCLQRASGLSTDETYGATFLDRLKRARLSERPGATSTVPFEQRDKRLATTDGPQDAPPPELASHPDYEIRRELGRGGMGVVYLAYNRLMGRNEVLKVMGRHIIERPGVMDRFLREIRAVAQLRHPNVVTAYTAFRNSESLVFAMEYVEGLDLARMVGARGPMPIAHACQFIQQAALGLDHAHEFGMVHRDIKPSNLMLSRNRNKAHIKVLDFGLAKASFEDAASVGLEQLGANPLMNRNLTLDGQMLGTPDFVAPEQIVNAQAADIRADIYSLGCTLYYLLSGRAPFSAETLYDILQAHGSRDARLLNVVRRDVPSELAVLVAKMMAKDPDRRFQAPEEVAKALTPFYKKTSKTAVSPGASVPPVKAPGVSPSTAGLSEDLMISGPARTTPAPRNRARAEEMWKSVFDLDEAEEIQPALRGPGRRWDQLDRPVGHAELGVETGPKAIASRPKRKRRRPIHPAVVRRIGLAVILLCAVFGTAIVGFWIVRSTRIPMPTTLNGEVRKVIVGGSAGGEGVNNIADTPPKQAPKNLKANEVVAGGSVVGQGVDKIAERPPSPAPYAIKALDQAIALRPADPALRFERGDLLARHGDWKAALADFRKGLARDPTDTISWMRAATLYLQLGDVEGYRRHARAMLDSFGDTADPVTAERTAKVGLLTAPSSRDGARLTALAELAVANGAGTPLLPWYQFPRGMAAYRDGQFALAADFLRAADESITNNQIKPAAKLFRAMAEARLGRGDSARTLLDGARVALEQISPPAADPGAGWHDWLICQIVLREAEAVLGQPPPPPAGPPAPDD